MEEDCTPRSPGEYYPVTSERLIQRLGTPPTVASVPYVENIASSNESTTKDKTLPKTVQTSLLGPHPESTGVHDTPEGHVSCEQSRAMSVLTSSSESDPKPSGQLHRWRQ